MPRALRCADVGAVVLLMAAAAQAQQPSPGRQSRAGGGADGGADRIVAERVLRLGGAVILSGQHRPIHDLDDLPDTDFRLHTLDLVGVSMGAWGLKDELSRWPPLPNLKELYLNGRLWYNQPMSLVADTIGLFASATGLEKLVLSKPVQTYIPLEDAVLERLSNLSAIEELRLEQTRLPGSALAPFTKLRLLDLSHNRFFDDGGLRHVGRMTALTKLYLTGTTITDEGLRNLEALTNLIELDLDGTGISDAGLAHLTGLTKLRRLNLLGSKVTDSGLVHLQHMTSLEELTLYRTKVSNAGLAHLGSLKQLRHLDLRYSHPVAVSLDSTAITDRELPILQELPQLEDLSLRNTEVSDLGAAHVSRIQTLRKLVVSHTLLSDAALDKLGALTNLQTLDLSHTLVEGSGLRALSGLTALRELALSNTPLRDEGLLHLAGLTGLEKLVLS